MKKTIITLLSLMALGNAHAAYRYDTGWIETRTNWASGSSRTYLNGNFTVTYWTEDDDAQTYWGSNGEGDWQQVRSRSNGDYKMIRVFITGPGQRNGSKPDESTYTNNGTLYYSSNGGTSITPSSISHNSSRSSKNLSTIDWIGNSTDFTIYKIDDNFRGEYFKIFYSKPLNANNYDVIVTANYNPDGAATPVIKVKDKITGETIPASDFDWSYVAPCDGKTAGTYPGGIKLTSRSEDITGSLYADVTIKPADMSTVNVTSTSGTTPPSIDWTGGQLNPMSMFTLKLGSKTLVDGVDYDWYVTPTSTSTSTQRVVDPGRYTLVMVGKGNYQGTITRLFDVTKPMSMAESLSGIHFDLPEQILRGTTGLNTFNLEVKDNKTHQTLLENEDYTLTYYACKGGDGTDKYDIGTATTTLAGMTTEGKYWVKVAGKAPKYSGEINKAFYVVNQYQTVTPTDMPAVTMLVTDAGYPVAAESPTGAVIPGKVIVSRDKDDNPAIAPASTSAKIPEEMTSTIADKDMTFTVAGIGNDAFAGCATLRWIDSDIPAALWTPASLDRKIANTPFYGLPVHTLVYLNGTTVKGENYIYKITPSSYRCEKYHIYEDVSGKQTEYSDK